MKPKYESKYDVFYNNKQLDAVISEVAAEMKMEKIDIADVVHFFLHWQKDAFNEMKAPGYSWCGLGYITTTSDRIKRWDKMKEESKERKDRLTKQSNNQTNE